MSKPTLATIWLDGCSGCHMSFLDIDERILQLGELADLVCSPIVDQKHFPEKIDIALVEGSVSTDEDEHKIRLLRSRTRTLVAFGDCAVTGNVPAMRNAFPLAALFARAYSETATHNAQTPTENLPTLLKKSRPIHEFVPVDIFIPGCPPSADTIFTVLTDLLAGRVPDIAALTRFGA
jgi:NAD-reducing hydrogenase small subunit